MDNITLEKPPKLPKIRDADFDDPQFSDSESESDSSVSESSSSSSESSESSVNKQNNRKIYNDLIKTNKSKLEKKEENDIDKRRDKEKEKEKEKDKEKEINKKNSKPIMNDLLTLFTKSLVDVNILFFLLEVNVF